MCTTNPSGSGAFLDLICSCSDDSYWQRYQPSAFCSPFVKAFNLFFLMFTVCLTNKGYETFCYNSLFQTFAMFWMLHSFFRLSPLHLYFICRRFWTLCSIFIGGVKIGPPMKMEQTECSEMLAYKIQTSGNHPKERIQHSAIMFIAPARQLHREVGELTFYSRPVQHITRFDLRLTVHHQYRWII